MSGRRKSRAIVSRRFGFEPLEPRQVLSGGTFVPPPLDATSTNPVQTVKVIVLNYEPTVPSQGNQKLWEVFGWNDPRQLAAGYINDIESSSGGAIDYEIVEWRDLNEFPLFTDGTRYSADQYVQNRQTNTGWSTASADFYAIADQQNLAKLVNENEIDEIWMFGDHYFALLGEAWMAGPGSFFVNGPSFPEFPVDRAVAGFGFNYERGVAEMVHNFGHRTENHISRAYGGWNIANPVTPWDYFTANVAQSNTSTYGVGSVHYPFNGTGDYDYGNPASYESYADDFVALFPYQTYAATTTSREAWGDYGLGDWQRGYLNWFFGHMPRESGTAPDGRANNWFKYIIDFNAYRPATGLPRDNEAILGAPPLEAGGGEFYEFTLRFYDTTGIDVATLGTGDAFVTGPNGYSQPATLVEVEAEQNTTAGTARTVRYRVPAPNGVWSADDAGSYQVHLVTEEVQDSEGVFLPPTFLGQFSVNIQPGSALNVAGLIAAGEATYTATPWDIGHPLNLFDNSLSGLYRSQNINPATVTLSFDDPQEVMGFRTYMNGNTSRWRVEAANSLADLDSQTGSYLLLVADTVTPSDVYSTVNLGAPASATHFRLTVERIVGDNYVHINAWDFLSTSAVDTEAPTASLFHESILPVGNNVYSFTVTYADDQAIDISTINFGDIRVVGPNGYATTAALQGLNINADGPQREVTYFVAAPGAEWEAADNGVYAILLIEGEVRDLTGNQVPGGLLGTFVINLPGVERQPLPDMTELNASSWVAWADDGIASTFDDTSRKTVGQASVRFETTGAFDTYLRYAPVWGVDWDLTDVETFRFDIYAENFNLGFQEDSIVFRDINGSVREYRYFRDNNPYAIWNDARDTWLPVSVQIKSDLPTVTGWRLTDSSGAFDWEHVASVEIHADTWENGFTLWIDGAGFSDSINVVLADFVPQSTGHRIELKFDLPMVTIPVDSAVITNLTTGATIAPGDYTITELPTIEGLSHFEVAFPGFANGLLPLGVYRFSMPASAVTDDNGATLATDILFDFSTLPGDYVPDGHVDTEDYLFWKQHFGATSGEGLNADGNGNGQVDVGDFTIWRNNLGTEVPAASTATPEAAHVVAPNVAATPSAPLTAPLSHRRLARAKVTPLPSPRSEVAPPPRPELVASPVERRTPTFSAPLSADRDNAWEESIDMAIASLAGESEPIEAGTWLGRGLR